MRCPLGKGEVSKGLAGDVVDSGGSLDRATCLDIGGLLARPAGVWW